MSKMKREEMKSLVSKMKLLVEREEALRQKQNNVTVQSVRALPTHDE
jgi:hypothetical protein